MQFKDEANPEKDESTGGITHEKVSSRMSSQPRLPICSNRRLSIEHIIASIKTKIEGGVIALEWQSTMGRAAPTHPLGDVVALLANKIELRTLTSTLICNEKIKRTRFWIEKVDINDDEHPQSRRHRIKQDAQPPTKQG